PAAGGPVAGGAPARAAPRGKSRGQGQPAAGGGKPEVFRDLTRGPRGRPPGRGRLGGGRRRRGGGEGGGAGEGGGGGAAAEGAAGGAGEDAGPEVPAAGGVVRADRGGGRARLRAGPADGPQAAHAGPAEQVRPGDVRGGCPTGRAGVGLLRAGCHGRRGRRSR